MKYMIQLAAMTDTRKSTKQYMPYRTMALGVERCVMPKTTDAKPANKTTAVK
jgi:hypothetical protein